jgi:hypothetical protein
MPSGATINSERYVWALQQLKHIFEEFVLLCSRFSWHDNTRPHTSPWPTAEIHRLGFTDLDHPQHRPDLTSSLPETRETSESTSLLVGRWSQDSGEDMVPSTRRTVTSWRTHKTTRKLAEVCGRQRWFLVENRENYRMKFKKNARFCVNEISIPVTGESN